MSARICLANLFRPRPRIYFAVGIADLKRHFLRERNAVAFLWVQQTTAAIRRIMRRHLEASRLSEDIEFAMEARIFLQYAQLRLICAVLFLLIGLAGPQRLHGMALSADKLTQRIGNVLRSSNPELEQAKWMVRDLPKPHRVGLEWSRVRMSATVRLVPVQEVYDDLLHRTLSRISCDLGRLIYLASTRDYNTGNIITRDLPAASARRLHAKRWKWPTGKPFIRFPAFR